MEAQLRQAFNYYDRRGEGHLSVEDCLVVLQSANVAVSLEDVKVFMNKQYATEEEVVTAITWDACLSMAMLYTKMKVGLTKVSKGLDTFKIENTNEVNVTQLRHCLRSLTPASIHVTGADVAEYTLQGIKPENGKAKLNQILHNF